MRRPRRSTALLLVVNLLDLGVMDLLGRRLAGAELLRLRRAPAGSMPIFCLSAMSCASALAAPCAFSSALKSRCSRSPVNSSSISAIALIMRSLVAIFSSIRANASKADFSDIDDIVSAMRFCACARRWRARSRFFLRFASSILSLRSRSDDLELLGLGLVRLPRQLELLRVRRGARSA